MLEKRYEGVCDENKCGKIKFMRVKDTGNLKVVKEREHTTGREVKAK